MRKISQTWWSKASNFSLTRRCIPAYAVKLLNVLGHAAFCHIKCARRTPESFRSCRKWHWPGHQPKGDDRGSMASVRVAKGFANSRRDAPQAWPDHHGRTATCRQDHAAVKENRHPDEPFALHFEEHCLFPLLKDTLIFCWLSFTNHVFTRKLTGLLGSSCIPC